MKMLLKLTVIFINMCFINLATATPIDLSTWLVDGGGNWSFNTTNAPNDSADQADNSIPTVLFNNQDSQGISLSGSIKVQTSSDDDFIGFVLGYDNDDLFGTNPTTDYILVDWKQGTQSGWDAGMAISRVTGGPIANSGVDTGGDAWTHTGNVELLERAATFGNVGWVNFEEYIFDISFTASNIKVSVNDVEQFNINGTFENGSFGFYNFSQPNVRYAGITEEVIPDEDEPDDPGDNQYPVPEPEIMGLFALCLLGIRFYRT